MLNFLIKWNSKYNIYLKDLTRGDFFFKNYTKNKTSRNIFTGSQQLCFI